MGLLSRLVLGSQHFAKQFMLCDGLQSERVRRLLSVNDEVGHPLPHPILLAAQVHTVWVMVWPPYSGALSTFLGPNTCRFGVLVLHSCVPHSRQRFPQIPTKFPQNSHKEQVADVGPAGWC